MHPMKTTALAIGLAVAPIAGFAQEPSDARIKELALEAIRENPQIIMEAVQLLEQEQAATQAEAAADLLKIGRAHG